MVNTVNAMKAGRVRWLARLKTEDKPVPFGRKKGGRNRTVEERARAAHEKQCEREYRRIQRQVRADRRARKQELADLDRRRQRFQAGQAWDNGGEPMHSGSHNLGLAAVTAEIAARYPPRDPEDFSRARHRVDMGELFDLALDNMSELGGRKIDLRLLKRVEKAFIKALSDDYRMPLRQERAAWRYNRLCRWEEPFAGTDGQAERLAHLQQAFDNFQKRRRVDGIVKQLARERSARADPLTERRQCDRPHCGCPNGVCV
jgi:hypothetical protein